MFDKVCVIYRGRMAYYGPAGQARQYFVDMGYNPAHRQTTADFLVAVTDPLSRIPREDVVIRPRTAEEFAEHFKNSPLGKRNIEDMEWYRINNVTRTERAVEYRNSVLAEHARNVPEKSPYTVSISMQIRAVMVRKLQMMAGSWKLQVVIIA
jgi:ATP-binding cassette, subfamily G (WHITE), member 2, SNQ2